MPMPFTTITLLSPAGKSIALGLRPQYNPQRFGLNGIMAVYFYEVEALNTLLLQELVQHRLVYQPRTRAVAVQLIDRSAGRKRWLQVNNLWRPTQLILEDFSRNLLIRRNVPWSGFKPVDLGTLLQQTLRQAWSTEWRRWAAEWEIGWQVDQFQRVQASYAAVVAHHDYLVRSGETLGYYLRLVNGQVLYFTRHGPSLVPPMGVRVLTYPALPPPAESRACDDA